MMTATALIYYLVSSLALNAALFWSYRRERDRRFLMCMCLDLPRTSDWWRLYSKAHFIMVKVEKVEGN